LGIALACLIEPLVHRLQGFCPLRRGKIVGLVLSAFWLFIFFILMLIIVSAYQEFHRVLPKVPALVERIASQSRNWLQGFSFLGPQFDGEFKHRLVPAESITQLLRTGLNYVLVFLSQLPQILIILGLGGIAAYFFSRDKNLISKLFYTNLPLKWRPLIRQIKTELLTIMARYIRVELSISGLVFFATTTTLWIVGIPGALTYGTLAGLLDLMPVLGSGLIYLPMIFVQLLFHRYDLAIILSVAYFGIIFMRQMIELRLIGENLRLHPLFTLFIIYLGMKVFGGMGIILGPILMITLRICYRSLSRLPKISFFNSTFSRKDWVSR
jgi:sporulation integral membrane protein YtvI